MTRVTTPSVADHRPRGRGRHTGTTFVRSSLALVAVATVLGTAVGLGGRAFAAAPTVQVGTDAAFGTILTTGSGFALYTLTSDHNGQSTCHGSCAAAWPPLTVPAGTAATPGPGVTGTVGTSRQSNGTFQVTYNGAPLYTFVSDTAPGQVTGNGVADFVVVVVSPATTPTTPTTPTTAPAGTASTGASPASGASGPGIAPASSTGPATATAPAGTASTGAAVTGPGALAFTGPGSGLTWLFWFGLGLALLGGLLMSRPGLRRMRRTQ